MSAMKTSLSRKAFLALNYILLAAFALICVLPMLHVLFSSISDPNWLNSNRGLVLWPVGINLTGYALVFKNVMLIKGFLNTVQYVAIHLVIGLLLTLTGGYVLAKRTLLWKNVIMFIISFTMLFNGGLVPTYINLSNLKLTNSIWAVVLPGAISVFNLILIRTAFSTVPESLLESARLDGAGRYRILFSISLPLITATVATVSLYMIIGMWNSWFPAAMYLSSRELYPMQLILREILIVNQQGALSPEAAMGLEGDTSIYAQLVKYSTIIVSSAPMIILYPFIMKYFKSGMKIGAIKG